MNLDLLIRDVQRAVGVPDDGKDGPQTWAAIHARILGAPTAPASLVNVAAGQYVDARSETSIATLHARVQPYARSLVQAAAAQGITIKVISGARSYAEQAVLYAQGRTAPGKRVTNAGPGYSNHNFGLAFDVGAFDENGKYLDESPLYKVVGAIGCRLGLEWGGNWRTIVDEPHFQLRPPWASGLAESDMLAELRRRHQVSKDAFA